MTTTTLERLLVPVEWKALADFDDADLTDEEKQLKADDAGTLVGYASTFGNVDLGGDVVQKGAFTKSVARIKKEGIPLLADHVPTVNSVLGSIFDAAEDTKGLKIYARFSEAASAQDARTKLLERHVKTMSIGYETIDQKFGDKDGQRVRFLTEVKLWEVSVVVFPMNPEAVVSTVKSLIQPFGVDVEEMIAEATRVGAPGEEKATANETREALYKALREYHENAHEWAYLRDYDDSKVWYELYSTSERGALFERTYELDDDTAAVSLGETATKVRAVVTYVPVAEEDDSKGITLRLGESNTSEGDEPSTSGDEPDEKAADPAASAGDEPSGTPDEGAGWDRWASQAVMSGRDPDAKVDSATRAGLDERLSLMESYIERSRDLLKSTPVLDAYEALQADEPNSDEETES